MADKTTRIWHHNLIDSVMGENRAEKVRNDGKPLPVRKDRLKGLKPKQYLR